MSFTVAFTDTSSPGPSGPITAWAWDFGDGGTSVLENPTHAFSTTGNHSVQLTVTGSGSDGTSSTTHTVQVINPGAIAAVFSTATSGLSVTFTDLSTAGPSGPITGWAWNFGDGGTSSSQNPSHTYSAAGSYTATLVVTGTSPDGTSTTTTGLALGGTNFISVTSWPRPPFTPTRTINFTTKAQLDAAISGMQGGDLIQYTGSGVLTISSSGSSNGYNLLNKNPVSPVVIDFGCSHNVWDNSKITSDYVAFRYTGTSSVPAFYFNNLSNIRLYGGDYSSGTNGGTGFGGAVGNTHNCYFWDMYIHDCLGGMGFIPKDGFSGALSTVNGNNIRAEVVNWGVDPSKDSHTQAPGTGLHGCLTADAGGTVTNNTFTIYGHNPTTVGCCFEIGSDLSKGSGLIQHNTIYVKAEHFHFHSTQTASNAVNLWGSKDLSTNTFAWIEGNDLYGTVMHSTSSTIASGMVVNHGRHSSTNLDPSDGIHVPYPTTYGIVYNDCT